MREHLQVWVFKAQSFLQWARWRSCVGLVFAIPAPQEQARCLCRIRHCVGGLTATLVASRGRNTLQRVLGIIRRTPPPLGRESVSLIKCTERPALPHNSFASSSKQISLPWFDGCLAHRRKQPFVFLDHTQVQGQDYRALPSLTS